jgi:hypothetical protein
MSLVTDVIEAYRAEFPDVQIHIEDGFEEVALETLAAIPAEYLIKLGSILFLTAFLAQQVATQNTDCSRSEIARGTLSAQFNLRNRMKEALS